MGRNKIVTCGKYLRIMRTDNINRHMLQHEKENYEKELICGSNFNSSTTSLQEETVSDFSSISTYTSTPINDEFVIITLMMNSDKYKKDIEVGKIVAKYITDGEKTQDSLSNKHKDALDLYGNGKELLSIENVILNSWQ